ncbi:hypothetical protein MBRA1_002816 [Malassezia brasiliensis]|uniref:Protein MEMO1 n=1 Tax=Malassezia brasiliensis TaxID=1821822 RepID=A0AAF0DZ16_9BASI|nr:hypothetical protein MBRA1_002816 [Malassezia brasiliensis]
MLSDWLQAATSAPASDTATDAQTPHIARHPVVKGCKAVIGPHAGYRFSGPTAAWAYGCIDPITIRRVIVLGPSHHAKLATPLGDLRVDKEVNDTLRTSKLFRLMSDEVDEDEHSMELHYPYIRKVFGDRDISVVPILVGQLSAVKAAQFAEVLAPHVADPATLVVVSTDFCHWGERFRYTYYQGGDDATPVLLSSRTSRDQYARRPIHASIAALDAAAMTAISYSPMPEAPVVHTSAMDARKAFSAYLSRTGNTICGRNPLMLLLATLARLEAQQDSFVCKFTHYAQSGAVQVPSDSSVSYAAGYVQQV